MTEKQWVPKYHHFYHIQGLTDLDKIREDANYRRRMGYVWRKEPSIIHHHKADVPCELIEDDRGDRDYIEPTQKHEVFELGEE